jgi:hypothetical protein
MSFAGYVLDMIAKRSLKIKQALQIQQDKGGIP